MWRTAGRYPRAPSKTSTLSPVLQKKICMLGSYAVGKTSLVKRFVHSIFEDKYQTTVGVAIDKKEVEVDGSTVGLMLWDIYGEDDFQKVRLSYLRGTHGFLLVADGTRPETMRIVFELHQRAQQTAGDVPFTLLLNKADLEDEWALTDEHIKPAINLGWTVLKTSAKTGANVEEAFADLARRMVS